jgi:hypothetical protein
MTTAAEKSDLHAIGSSHDRSRSGTNASSPHSHDMLSKVLARIQSAWSGTLIVLFQPNEERGGGAQAMVDLEEYD